MKKLDQAWAAALEQLKLHDPSTAPTRYQPGTMPDLASRAINVLAALPISAKQSPVVAAVLEALSVIEEAASSGPETIVYYEAQRLFGTDRPGGVSVWLSDPYGYNDHSLDEARERARMMREDCTEPVRIVRVTVKKSTDIIEAVP